MMPIDHKVDGMPKRTDLTVEGELRGIPYLVPGSAVRRLIQRLEGNVGAIGEEREDRLPSRCPCGYLLACLEPANWGWQADVGRGGYPIRSASAV